MEIQFGLPVKKKAKKVIQDYRSEELVMSLDVSDNTKKQMVGLALNRTFLEKVTGDNIKVPFIYDVITNDIYLMFINSDIKAPRLTKATAKVYNKPLVELVQGSEKFINFELKDTIDFVFEFPEQHETITSINPNTGENQEVTVSEIEQSYNTNIYKLVNVEKIED